MNEFVDVKLKPLTTIFLKKYRQKKNILFSAALFNFEKHIGLMLFYYPLIN